MTTREKEAHLHREATKFIDQHPVLSIQNTGKFEISIKPAVKELSREKGLGLSK
jgi:ribose 1,5-bisphosphokinase PhnN